MLALTCNLTLVPGGGAMTVVSLSAISALYMYLSFALFNGIRLREIFKRDSYKGIPVMRIIGAILTGSALSLTIIGLLFKFQSWPGAGVSLRAGLVGLIIAFIVGVMKYLKTKSDYYSRIFRRITVYGVLGLFFILLPKDTLLEFKYRNYPNYLESMKNAKAEPGNQELLNKVEEERKKMREEY